MKTTLAIAFCLLAAHAVAATVPYDADDIDDSPVSVLIFDDSIDYWMPWQQMLGDIGSTTLIEEDYAEIAEELGVDAPAIHAVVEIEAGTAHQGFWAEGKPLINFDLAQFKRIAQKRGVNLAKAAKEHPVVFAAPNWRIYGSQQAAQQARLDEAMQIDSIAAIEATFWGMFQIGGFNWKKCGAESIDDFVQQMSSSERDQLHLFANFLQSTGLDQPLRQHQWAQFARGYNGPSYASRGYHTKLANAYNKYR